MGKNKAHNRKKEAFFEKSETPISQTKDILGYKPPQNLYFIHYFYCFSVLSTYHIPTTKIRAKQKSTLFNPLNPQKRFSGKFLGIDYAMLPNCEWNQKQKHKKQPWSNVECFAFGPKDKNQSPFHGEKPQMTK
ncbi:MAG: hypothetical protein SPG08_05950 [Sodaliphilus sp.]|nr:hypothetical protein [Bacteroidales bacterium]MDY5568574.1 hypothetical protein [Sodaliphilus sp.]